VCWQHCVLCWQSGAEQLSPATACLVAARRVSLARALSIALVWLESWAAAAATAGVSCTRADMRVGGWEVGEVFSRLCWSKHSAWLVCLCHTARLSSCARHHACLDSPALVAAQLCVCLSVSNTVALRAPRQCLGVGWDAGRQLLLRQPGMPCTRAGMRVGRRLVKCGSSRLCSSRHSTWPCVVKVCVCLPQCSHQQLCVSLCLRPVCAWTPLL
jgi:hypothetical protein